MYRLNPEDGELCGQQSAAGVDAGVTVWYGSRDSGCSEEQVTKRIRQLSLATVGPSGQWRGPSPASAQRQSTQTATLPEGWFQESTNQRGSHCTEVRDRGGNGRYRETEGEGLRPSPNTCIRLRDSLNHSEGTGPGLIFSLHALAWCSCRLSHRTTVLKAGKQLRLDHASPNDIIQWPPSRWQWDLGRVHLDAGA